MGNFLPGGFGVAFEQLHTRENHAGGAIAALQAMTFPEAFLDRMELAIAGQPFDGSDLRAVSLDGEEGARFNSFALEQ